MKIKIILGFFSFVLIFLLILVFNYYKVNTSLYIYRDNNTSLTWKTNNLDYFNIFGFYFSKNKRISGDWDYANKYCNELNFGGYDDWRLPMVKELMTIIDYSKNEGELYNKSIFDIGNGPFWTSTIRPDSGLVWTVDFSNGFIYDYEKKDNLNFICVRQ